MWNEFKTFIMRGSVLDMAVGIIIGASFNKIVSSLVDDVIMPPVGLLIGGINFSNMFVNLGPGDYDTLAAAQEAGAATVNYGLFINTLLEFLIVALVVFLLIRQINRLRAQPEKQETSTTRPCPYCVSTIPLKATRCPQCTSDLVPA